jgi:hypothetical protein
MECLEGVAAVAHDRGRDADAIQLLSAATTLRDEVGEPLPEHARDRHTALLRHLEAAVPGNQFQEAWHAGAAMSPRQAVDLALAQSQPVPAFD